VTVMKEVESDEAFGETKKRRRAEKEQRRLEQKAAEEHETENKTQDVPTEQARPSERRPGFY